MGEDNTERDTKGDPKHEHGLEQECQIIVNYGHFSAWMWDPQVVPK